MRVAYVITRADAVGGATVHVRDLARAMLRRGEEACVFVGGTGPVTEQLDDARVPFQNLGYLRRSIHPVADVQAYRELRAALRDFAPDLVSTHTAKAGWLGRAAAHSLKIPCIYTPHGWAVTDRISRPQGLVYSVAERIAAPWADAIVCVSESEKRIALAKRIAPEHKLHVIYNGVRDIPRELLANPAAEPVRLVCIARLEAPKDHATLLAALSELRTLLWELDLAGDGPREPELRRLAAELGVAHRIHFLGYQRDTASVLARGQIFVLPSRSEGFPRSVLEAMRAGLPVVASDVGGVAEAVVHGETGYTVRPQSVRQMRESLEMLLKSASERQRMGSLGHLRYRERFRFESMESNTFQLYATLVGVAQRHE